MSNQDQLFTAACISGRHILEVRPGTELEGKCKEYAHKGYIDAFPLSSDDCPECVEDMRCRDRAFTNTCNAVDCPFTSDDCREGCIASVTTQGSPYDGQTRLMAMG